MSLEINAQPSTQATNISITPAGISWSTGNGTDKLVVISTNGGTFSPVNGVDYTADISSDFAIAVDKDGTAGVAKIVYGGTANTVLVTNLAASTFYTIRVYEFNNAGFLYNTSIALNNPIVAWYYANSGATTDYTVPAGINSATVQAWGGGGGSGGNTAASNSSVNGGGGGAYASSVVSVTPGNNYTVTIGNGGTGTDAQNATGGAGGNSSFSSLVVAAGGSGGGGNTTGGAGGTTAASTGTVKFAGGSGGSRQTGANQGGGGGGGSAGTTGVGGQGGNASGATGGTAGTAGPDGGAAGGAGGNNTASGGNGNFPGGGGGGQGGSGATTGDGAVGLVIVSYAPDITAPAVSSIVRQNPTASSTNVAIVIFRVTFSEDVINVNPADFTLGGTATGSIGTVTPNSASEYDVQVTGVGGNGTLDLDFAGGQNITDLSGNAFGGTSAGDQTYTIDTTAPVISTTAPASSSSTNNTNVSYTLSEAIASGTITWTRTGGTADGSSPHVQALTGTELTSGVHSGITLTNNPTLISGAIYSIAFDATDAAGNTATTITNTNITFDNAGPVFSATAPATSSSVNNTNVSYTLDEPLASGTITWTQTGGTADAGSPHVQALTGTELNTGAHSNITLTNNPTLVDGAVYSISFDGSDALGNAATTVTNTNITFDITDPVISATAPASSSSVNNANVSYTLSEAIASGTITWTQTGGPADGGSPHVQALTGTELNAGAHSNITLTNNPTLVNGAVYSIDFDATDAAGNTATSVTNTNLTFDNSAPVFSAVAPTTSSSVNSAQVSYTLNEALLSGTITWTRTGGTADAGSPHIQALTGTELSAGAHSNITLTNNPALVDGAIYSISLDGSDAAGNAATTVTNTNITFDNTVPAISATAPTSTSSVNNSNVSYTLSEAIGSGTITWSRTGGTADPGSPHVQALTGTELTTGAHSDITLTNNPVLVSGTVYSIAFNATDAAGNAAITITNTNITFDNTDPVFSATAPSASSRVNNANVSYTLSEAITSGTITWTEVGGPLDASAPHIQALAGTELNAGIHSDITLTNNPPLVDGAVYTLTFDGADAAGNNATTVTNTNVAFDITAPGLSPDEMNFNSNAASVETIIFTINEELSVLEGGNITGFTTSTGTIASAVYTGKGTTNTITLTSAADGQWTAATTVSYSAGNVTDLAANAMLDITNHALTQSVVNLGPGSIAFTSFKSDDPNSFSIVLLEDATNGTTIKFTDNGWSTASGGSLRTSEQTFTWTANTTYFAGTEIVFTGNSTGGNPGTMTASVGTISPVGIGSELLISSSQGDQILAYQGASTSPTFLAAIQFNGGTWEADATDDQTSALPPGLTDGTHAVALGDVDNGAYNVAGGEITSGSVSTLLSNINNSSNWDTDGNPANVVFPSDGLTNYILPPDLIPVTPLSPANGSIVSATLPNLTITFDDNVTAGLTTGNDIVLRLDDGTFVASWNVGTAAVSIAGATVTINTGALALTDGQVYEIDVASRIFVNADGNGNTAIVGDTEWKFTADAIAPTVTSIVRTTPATTLTNATSVTYTVNFSENVTGLTASDFSLATGGTATGTIDAPSAASGTSVTVTVSSISGSGGMRLDLRPSLGATVSDGPGNQMTADFFGQIYTIDQTPPVVTSIVRTTPATALTNSTSVVYTVSFSEVANGLATDDFALTTTGTASGTIASVSGPSGSSVTVTVNLISGDGTLRLDVPGSATITDNATNALTAAFNTGQEYTIDIVRPIVSSISRTTASPTNATSVTFQAVFDEDVTGVDASDFTPVVVSGSLTLGALSVTPLNATTYNVSFSVTGDGVIRLDVNGGTATISDAATNTLNVTFNTGETYLIDQTAPVIQDIVHNPLIFNSWAGSQFITTPAYNGNEVDFIVTFSEPINNLGDPQIFDNYNTGSANFPGVTSDLPPDITPVDINGDPATAPSRYWKIVYSNVSGSGYIFPHYQNVGSAVTDPAGNAETHTASNFFGYEDGTNTRFYYVALPQPTFEINDATFTAIATTPTSITLQWDHSGGTQRATDYVVRAKESSIVSFPLATSIGDGSFPANDLDASDGILLQHVNSNAWPTGPASQTIVFSGLRSGVNYDFEIYPYTLSDNIGFTESIDYNTTSFATFTASTTVEAQSTVALVLGGGTISSTTNTASGQQVLRFTITDDGTSPAADNAPFKFNSLKIIPAEPGNTIDKWTEVIAGAELREGTAPGTIVAATMSINEDMLTGASNIIFDNIASTNPTDPGFIADNSTKTYFLRIWLKSDLSGSQNYQSIIDGLRFNFLVDETSFTYNDGTLDGSDQASSELLSSSFTQSGNVTVNVIASRLVFTTQPTTDIGVDVVLPQQPVVQAQDINGNLDLSYHNVALTVATDQGLPLLSVTTLTVNGILAFSGFSYGDDGNGAAGNGTLKVFDGAGFGLGGLIDATSDPVNVSYSDDTQILAGTLNNIPVASIVDTQAEKEDVFDFTIQDDVAPTINDGTETRIRSITIVASADNDGALTDWTELISGAELRDDEGNISNLTDLTISANSLKFDIDPSALGYISDDLDKTYTLAIWLRNDIEDINTALADIVDNKTLGFEVTEAGIELDGTDPESSRLSPSDANSGGNAITVSATQLDFTTQWVPNAAQSYDAPFVPVPVAKARDENGNVDFDYTTAATVETANPTTYPLANSTVTYTVNAGTRYLSFDPNLQVTSAGGGLNGDITHLVLSSGTLTDGISNDFELLYSENSDIIRNAGFTYPTNILYAEADNQVTNITSGTGVALEEFTVRDGGGAVDSDGSPTKLSSITIRVTNYQFLRRLAIYNDDTGDEVGDVDVTPGANVVIVSPNVADVTFSGIPEVGAGSFQAPDDANPANAVNNLIIKASFNSAGVTDREVITFEVMEVIAGGVSSAFGNSNPAGIASSVTGDQNKIQVVATRLDFTTHPNPINISTFTNVDNPYMVVSARDEFLNLDIDYTGAVGAITNTCTGCGAAGASLDMDNAPTGNFVAGIFNFEDFDIANAPNTFQFTEDTGFGTATLTVPSGGLTSAVSDPFQVAASEESQIKGDNTFTFVDDIPYINYQATDIQSTDIDDGDGSFELARMLLSDGDADGVAGDVDGAETALTSLTLAITNHTHIRKIALYNSGASGATELAELADTDFNGSGEITFSGLNIEAPDDGTIPISIRVSFNNTSATIIDNSLIRARIVDAVLGGGSKFFNPSPTYIAGVDGGLTAPANKNFIEVTATKLDFTTQPAAFAGIDEPVTTGIIKAQDHFDVVDLDFNFLASLSTPDNNISSSPNTFINGVLNLTGLQYNAAGDGTITANANGISSIINNTVNGLPNVSVSCTTVNVIHVTTSLATGGVYNQNLGGGAKSKVIFGVTFKADHTVSGEPMLNKFVIGFNTSSAGSIIGVFENIKVFESVDNIFAPGVDTDVTSPGIEAKITIASKSITVDFNDASEPGVPRDLSTNGELTYFLMVDVASTANASTPELQPKLEDEGFGTSTNDNIMTSNGSAVSNITGKNYNFAAVLAPQIVSSFPASGQLNVAVDQPSIDLVWSVPVWTLDSKIKLFYKTNGAFVADLPALNGFYDGGNKANLAGTVATPLRFQIPAGLLRPDSVYYITIAPGSQGNSTGVMDEFNNLSPGFSFSEILFFKTAKPQPPILLKTPVASKNPNITNISLTGATINATFDQQGTAYFMVVPQGSTAPTNAEIKGDAIYPGSPIRGNFVINQINPVTQFGLINPTLAGLTGLAPGATYDVWICAESYSSNNGVLTPIPTAAPYGSLSENFSVGAPGPTLSFTAPAGPGPGVTVFAPIVQFCSNSYQTLNSPIVLVEGPMGGFNTGGVLRSFNLLLPSGFQFDNTTVNGVPVHGTVTLSGSDFIPGSDSLSFINNSILTVYYASNGSASRDNITISGLRVFTTSATSGNVVRLGGDAINSLADNTIFAKLSTFDAQTIGFTNSYTVEQYAGKEVTIIPDDYNPPDRTVQLIPQPLKGDYGSSSFSGTGVNINQLNLSAVTLGVPFNITITHTDNNGCVSQNPIQYTVYDHEKAIGGLATKYGLNNSNFPGLATVGIDTETDTISIAFDNNKPASFMTALSADIAETSQIISGPAWEDLIQNQLLVRLADHDPFNDIAKLAYDYEFYEATLLNANTLSGGVITDPYINFYEKTQKGNVYYTGGSLGKVEFTGTYISVANNQVDFPLKQSVEFFVAPIPIVEVDESNLSSIDTEDLLNPIPVNADTLDPRASNRGTLVFCQSGGQINITGFPRAEGASVGRFILVNAADTSSIIYNKQLNITPDGFVDNNNGTATLDPSKVAIRNNNEDIMIIYRYKETDSPIGNWGSQIIRIEPNPVADFTNDPYTCAGTEIGFTNASTPLLDSEPFKIDSVVWAFDDDNVSAEQNTSDLINPSHTFRDPGTYHVTLTAFSEFGCRSNISFKDLVVGAVPEVSFDFAGVSTGDMITFRSTSQVDDPNLDDIAYPSNIVALDWDFDDSGTAHSITNDTIKYHQYLLPGKYDVKLEIRSTVGCIDSLRQTIVVVPHITSDAASVEETFESDDAGWQVMQDPASSIQPSWKHGAPTGAVIQDASNAWTTGSVDGAAPVPYNSGERSALYTSAYDISQLIRPMISFNSFVHLQQSDGVVLEYSTDSLNIADAEKEWHTLGSLDASTSISSGVDWYNGANLASKPGDQDLGYFGWTETVDPDNDNIQEWIEAKHNLSSVTGERSRLVFRFALASVSDTERDGFAIDNFRIGNRTRIVLVENFRNLANTTTETRNPQGVVNIEKAETDFFNDPANGFLPVNGDTSVIRINYHVGFPGLDPLNKDNEQDPGARALYYNISQTPRARMDGEQPDGATYFSTWGLNHYNTRSLKLADAIITPEVVPDVDGNGSMGIRVNVTALKDLGSKTILHIAVVEKSISMSALSQNMQTLIRTGENNFDYVLKKMIPNAAGTRFNQMLANTQTRAFPSATETFTWSDNVSFYAPGNLALIVFLQDEETREIYQTEIRNLSDPSVVTGIEDINHAFKVYPNPADRQMTIELPELAIQRTPMQLYDQMGKLVHQSTFEKGDTRKTIDTDELAGGVYLIQIESQNGILRRKVMVLHRN